MTLTTDRLAFPNRLENLIIYRAIKPGIDCPDGLAAAYVASQYVEHIKEEEFVLFPHYSYGDPLPELQYLQQFRFIYIIDCSFSLETLQGWRAAGIHLKVLDRYPQESSAALAWKYFFSGEPMPDYLRYVKDLALCEQKLPFAEKVYEAISSERYQKRKEVDGDEFEYRCWLLNQHFGQLLSMSEHQLIQTYASDHLRENSVLNP